MLTWVESTSLAALVRDSLLLTATLSGVHVLGMVVVTGGALIRGLYSNDPAVTTTMRWGLLASVLTGLLMVLPRAQSASANHYFDLKMVALALAVSVETLGVRRRAEAGPPTAVTRLSMALWVAVAACGAAFILLE